MTPSPSIVSLCPSITESLIALGLREQLLGITRFCIHPHEVVAGVEKLGGTKDPKLGRIRELKPDLVFMNREENRREDHEALSEALDVDVTLVTSVGEVPEHLRHLGRRTGTRERAESLAQELEHQLHALSEVRVKAGLQPTPSGEHADSVFSYAYLIWKDPLMSVNRDTYVNDLLAWAGGRNVFAELSERYPALTEDALRAADPQMLLLPDEPFPFAEKHLPEMRALAPEARQQLVGGDDLCWHGVRTIRGVAQARELLLGCAS